jgi:hypothetical protein
MRDDPADELSRIAARAVPAVVADGPFGRAATALERPFGATAVDGREWCQWADHAGIDAPEEVVTVARSIGRLHPDQAFAMGHGRAGPGEPATGRFAIAYEWAEQASTDLRGRRLFIETRATRRATAGAIATGCSR